jgi:hypothetical protein
LHRCCAAPGLCVAFRAWCWLCAASNKCCFVESDVKWYLLSCVLWPTDAPAVTYVETGPERQSSSRLFCCNSCMSGWADCQPSVRDSAGQGVVTYCVICICVTACVGECWWHGGIQVLKHVWDWTSSTTPCKVCGGVGGGGTPLSLWRCGACRLFGRGCTKPCALIATTHECYRYGV